jgi:hypothetical protein
LANDETSNFSFNGNQEKQEEKKISVVELIKYQAEASAYSEMAPRMENMVLNDSNSSFLFPREPSSF